MKCVYCGYLDSRVIESRPTEDVSAIRRRRECPRCGRRFTTYERVEYTPLVVVKKDGSREMFSREKILGGVLRACEKRRVPLGTLEALSGEVEAALREEGRDEVYSSEIGEMVMDRLRHLDEVAYVRFASVYRDFTDLGGFREELERILERKTREENPERGSKEKGKAFG